MALIGSIDIAVGATTRKLRKGLQTSSALLRGFASKMGRVFKGLGTAGIAGIGALGGMAFAMQRVGNEVDKLAKTSDKLNIPIDRLQGMQQVAEKTGVASEAFNVAMQRMTRRLSEAAKTGSGATASALEEIGLRAEDLVALEPDEAFLRITDSMQGVENQADKVRIAFSLFDTEGVGLVNTMALGSDAIREQRDLLKDLGLAIDRDGAGKVEQFNDMWSDFLFIADAVVKKLVVAIAPAMVALGQTVTENEDGVVDLGETIGDFANFAVKAIGIVLNAVETLAGGFKLAQSGATTLTGELAKGLKFLAEQFGDLTESQEIFFEAFEEEATRTADSLAAEGFKQLKEGLAGQPAIEFQARVRELDTSLADMFADQFDSDLQQSIDRAMTSTRPSVLLAGSVDLASAINQPQNSIAESTSRIDQNTRDTADAVNTLIREFRLGSPSAALIRL